MNYTVIAENYKNYTLNLASVQKLDVWLEKNYGIKFFETELAGCGNTPKKVGYRPPAVRACAKIS